MILVTGANGQTGHAVIRRLVAMGCRVRGVVSRPSSAAAITALGAEPVLAGLQDVAALRRAMEGVRRVYHICPSLSSAEYEIGCSVLEAALQAGVQRLVLHSGVNPAVREIPFHWNKLRVQEAITHSGIPYTFIQPTGYYANVGWTWPLVQQGRLEMPYSPDVRVTWVDLDDVAEVVGRVLTEDGFEGGTYELVGTAPLSRHEVAAMLTRAVGHEVRATAIGFDEYLARARQLPRFQQFGDDELELLRIMFRHFDQHGYPHGNPFVLQALLGRPPTRFEDYLERFAAQRRELNPA